MQATLIIILAIIIGSNLSAEQQLQFVQWGIYNNDGIRVRKEPNINGEILTNGFKGQRVRILAFSNWKDVIGEKNCYWMKVQFQGVQGWSFGAFIDLDLSDNYIGTYNAPMGNPRTNYLVGGPFEIVKKGEGRYALRAGGKDHDFWVNGDEIFFRFNPSQFSYDEKVYLDRHDFAITYITQRKNFQDENLTDAEIQEKAKPLVRYIEKM